MSYNNEAGEFEPNRLPENVKQEIRAITGAIGTLVGGVSGSARHGNGNAVDVLTNAQVGGVVGQNAVENNIVESLWDAVNVSLGVVSFQDNFRNGNYGSATVDAIGLLYDIPATVVPLLPAGASTGIKVYRASNSVRASATIARGATKINNAANIATRNTLNTAKNSASIGSKGAANRLSGAASSYFGGANKATGIQLATAGVLYSTSYSHLNTISSNQGQGSHEGGQKQNQPAKATATQPQQVVAAAGAPMPPDPDDHNNGNNRHNESTNIKEGHREYVEKAINDMRLRNPQTTRGASQGSASQIEVTMSQEEAMVNLERNGFTRHATRSPNTYYLEKGNVRYNFYPRSTGRGMPNVQKGRPSASLFIEGKEVPIKIRFPSIK